MNAWDCAFITMVLIMAMLQWLSELADQLVEEKWKEALMTFLAFIGTCFLIYSLWTKGYHA